MLPKQTIRKIQQLDYIQCPKNNHESQQLSMICLDSDCSGNRLSCCHCESFEHQTHTLLPLKEYLAHVYQQRRLVNPSVQTKMRGLIDLNSQTIPYSLNSTFNYLSCIQSIQNTKTNAIASLHSIKQKILQQIAQIQTQIKTTADKYIDKIRLLSQVYFSHEDIIDKLNNINEKTTKAEKILQDLIENLFPPTQLSQNQSNFDKNPQQFLSKQFDQVCNSFKQKMQNLNKSLPKLQTLFSPLLFKNIQYCNVKFSNFSNFQWDPLYKAQGFEIVGSQNKIIRVQSPSNSAQRVALMKTCILKESKNKLTWAIKINKLIVWIGVGLGLRTVINKAQYKFNYNTIGHGMYITSGNGYTWSHSETENNSKCQGFSFATGDLIVMVYDPAYRKLQFIKYDGKENKQRKFLNIAEYDNDDCLCPCVNMLVKNDEVEIVAVPEGY